jgi:hypothetical protein
MSVALRASCFFDETVSEICDQEILKNDFQIKWKKNIFSSQKSFVSAFILIKISNLRSKLVVETSRWFFFEFLKHKRSPSLSLFLKYKRYFTMKNYKRKQFLSIFVNFTVLSRFSSVRLIFTEVSMSFR